ncbi:MAG: hypothetical protein IJI06_06405 [Oscillospiraceae bacterium]|nr:hypothetical protein [Oscillospiraceae bacterium]
MKRFWTVILCLAIIVSFSACGHQHTWQEATCTSPKTCSECGETEGEALGHTWIDATCEEPKTCLICGLTEGEANGHVWEAATCQHPEQCAVCGSTKNSQLGDHICNTWSEIVDASCSDVGYKKGTCINCGQEFTVVLEKLPHKFEDWVIDKAASCVEIGSQSRVCADCGFEEVEEIPLLDHSLDEWKTTKDATYNENGKKEQLCLVCKNVINSEEFSFADTIKDKVDLKGDVDGLVATDARILYKSSWGYIFGKVIIEVTNNSDYSIKISKASIDIVDSDHAMLDTVDEYSIHAVPAIVEPGQKGYLLADYFTSADELETRNGVDVKAFVTVQKTTDVRSQWEFTDLNTKGNDPVTVGHIKNIDTVTYSGFEVYCLYRDATGRVIGYTSAFNNNEIAPDEAVSFGSDNLTIGLIKGTNIAEVECIGLGYKQ